ncbi:MAG: hypothetical protein LBV74_20160 [Tannerella sp.]|nr:hypothetical protein [Tannerella sp.]
MIEYLFDLIFNDSFTGIRKGCKDKGFIKKSILPLHAFARHPKILSGGAESG